MVVVISVHIYADVSVACPIGGDLVMLLEDVEEMIGVFFSNIFDTEIVYGQTELDGLRRVLPQTRYKFTLHVAMFVQSFF